MKAARQSPNAKPGDLHVPAVEEGAAMDLTCVYPGDIHVSTVAKERKELGGDAQATGMDTDAEEVEIPHISSMLVRPSLMKPIRASQAIPAQVVGDTDGLEPTPSGGRFALGADGLPELVQQPVDITAPKQMTEQPSEQRSEIPVRVEFMETQSVRVYDPLETSARLTTISEMSQGLQLRPRMSDLSAMRPEETDMDVHVLLRRRTQDAIEVLAGSDISYVDLLLLAFGIKTGDEFGKRKRTRELEMGIGLQAICHRAAKNILFKLFFGTVLFSNLCCLAVEADANAYRAGFPDTDTYVDFLKFQGAAEHVFTVLFILEIFIRVMGCPTVPWKDGWLIADGVIVAVSIIDVWFLAVISTQGNVDLPSLATFRTARLLRAVRALRAVRLFRFVRPMRIVAEALSEAMRHTFWTILMILFLNWCVSIIIVGGVDIWRVNEWDPTDRGSEEWAASQEMPYSMFEHMSSALMVLESLSVNGVLWGPRIINPMLFAPQGQFVSVGGVLLAFVCVTIVWLVNIIRGIFISSLLEAVTKDRSFMWQRSLLSGDVSVPELKRVFRRFDASGVGVLTKPDFLRGVEENPKFCESIGITQHLAESLFRQLDGNRSGAVTHDEFLIGCLKLTCKAKSMSMLCQDYMHLKTNSLLYTLGVRYDRDFKLIRHSIKIIDQKLHSLSHCAQTLIKDCGLAFERDEHRMMTFCKETLQQGVNKGVSTDNQAQILLDLEERFGFKTRLDAQIILDLEERFGFKTRLDDLEESVRARMEDLDMSARARKDDDRGGLGVINHVWDDVLFQEALPWVRDRLAEARKELDVAADGISRSAPLDTSHWLLRKSLLSKIDPDSTVHSATAGRRETVAL